MYVSKCGSLLVAITKRGIDLFHIQNKGHLVCFLTRLLAHSPIFQIDKSMSIPTVDERTEAAGRALSAGGDLGQQPGAEVGPRFAVLEVGKAFLHKELDKPEGFEEKFAFRVRDSTVVVERKRG